MFTRRVGAKFKGDAVMSKSSRKGFTLVELAVVIVIIGVLAAFGVPRFLKSVERSKAAEAFQYLAAIRASQERYITKEGVYCDQENKDHLDITQNTPKYFFAGDITTAQGGSGSTTDSTWTLTLTRMGSTSSYGSYSVTFTQDGFDSANSTITSLTDINPMGT
jgi:type IV pilus assembly protein PilA